MTAWPDVTVAILSHRRPGLLRRVVGAVAQLDYPAFEIVVVGDHPDIADYGLAPDIAAQIRYHQQIGANISRARNLALRLAGGGVVAFCDDDAAPEPDWLRELAKAFRRCDVAAASGTVLASDGLSVEWQGRHFASSGRDAPVELPQGGLVFAGPCQQIKGDRYLGLIGANSAFRRAAVLEAGGFDEAFEYFLEETDMALRLAQNGWSAALVPGAVVHHMRAPNASRSAAGVPKNLFQIAASKAHFCHRHLRTDQVPGELARFRADRLRRLDSHARLGTLRADGLRRLSRQLDRGLNAGAGRDAILPLSAKHAVPAFAGFQRPGPTPALRIALVNNSGLQTGHIRRLARLLAGAGHMVSCFSYSPGVQPARVTFSDGYWLHRSGTWRRNRATESVAPGRRHPSRALAEIARVMPHRKFDVILRPGRARIDGPAVELHLRNLPGPITAWTPDGGSAPSSLTIHALEAALCGGGRAEDASETGTLVTDLCNAGPAIFRISSKRYDVSAAPVGRG